MAPGRWATFALQQKWGHRNSNVRDLQPMQAQREPTLRDKKDWDGTDLLEQGLAKKPNAKAIVG